MTIMFNILIETNSAFFIFIVSRRVYWKLVESDNMIWTRFLTRKRSRAFFSAEIFWKCFVLIGTEVRADISLKLSRNISLESRSNISLKLVYPISTHVCPNTLLAQDKFSSSNLELLHFLLVVTGFFADFVAVVVVIAFMSLLFRITIFNLRSWTVSISIILP